MKKHLMTPTKPHSKFVPFHTKRLVRLALCGTVAALAGAGPRLQAQPSNATLQITAVGTNANLNWNNGGTLQYSTSLGGPWTTYSGGVSVLSSSSLPISGSAKFFRVVNNGVAGPPVALLPNSLSSPLQVETTSLQWLGGNASSGNTRVILKMVPGSISSSNIINLLVNNSITQLRDDGQFPDQVANDGNFSAAITLDTNQFAAWNAEFTNLPPAARFAYIFSGRAIVGTNALQAFPTTNFFAGQSIPILNNGTAVFPGLGPCTGSPLAYDPYKVLMITNLSVVADPLRTWDNAGAPQAFGAGGVGTQMGAWTFGRLMADMANVGAPGNTVSSASDFVMRCFDTWQYPQTINDDVIPAVPNIKAMVIDPWLAASAAEGLPTNTLDLAIAPFRLLAIVNRVDLRGNSTYGSTTQNSCIPSEPAGEARFVFGFIDPTQGTNSMYNPQSSNQLTVIFEYAVPIDACTAVQAWGAQWVALNNVSFTTPAVNPPTDFQYNQMLQKITDQFAKAGDNQAQMPNQSAIAQVRFNDFMGDEWALRQFNIDTRTGYLIESPVAATPGSTLNASPLLESFMGPPLVDSSFCSVGPLIPTPSLTIPVMYMGSTFLGGWAPEGVPTGVTTTSGMFWIGTSCNYPCTRHVLSLNTCNGCHTQETGTSFTHITPRSFGAPTTLSGFLTGATPPNPVVDVSGCSAANYNYSDLQRRVQDLNALVTCGCEFEIGRLPMLMTH